MTNKHFKHTGLYLRTFYSEPENPQTDIDAFDDRTLGSLAGKADTTDPILRSLERWGDLGVPTKLNGGSR